MPFFLTNQDFKKKFKHSNINRKKLIAYYLVISARFIKKKNVKFKKLMEFF